MKWIVATPFSRGGDDEWVPRYVGGSSTFVTVPARYDHDRSRRNASLADWREYLQHGLRAWREVGRSRREHAGLVTCFPQLALVAGLLKLVFARPDVPVVAWCFNLGRTYGGWKGWLARLAMRQIDVFVVHSRREIAVYSDWLRIDRDRFVFVPLSIRQETAVTAEDEEAPFLLAMGTANRDYATLLEAVVPLGIHVILVAGEHAIRGLPVPEHLTVLSDIDIATCHTLSQQARINVVPLRDTGFTSGQVTVLEAMMLGRSVIATRSAGTEDYIADGSNGLLVPPMDAGALRAAIETLWHDAARRKQLGSAARRYVMENATFPAVAQAMQAILEEAARRKLGADSRPQRHPPSSVSA